MHVSASFPPGGKVLDPYGSWKGPNRGTSNTPVVPWGKKKKKKKKKKTGGRAGLDRRVGAAGREILKMRPPLGLRPQYMTQTTYAACPPPPAPT
eukprot:2016274-Prymnesium_polylepis.1